MGEKQFDVLIGISRSMEKSLSAIESAMSKNGSGKGADKKVGKAGAVLGGLGSSLESLIAAVAVMAFDAKKGDEVITFSEKLVEVANKVTSTAAKDFGEFARGLGEAFEVLLKVMSPMKIIKLKLASKILFEGKKPLLTTIISGMQNAFKNLDSKEAAQGAKALKNTAEGLLSLTKALGGLIIMGLAAPLVLLGALVARGVAALFVGIGAKAKQLEKGADAFKTMGKGILWLTMGLAALTLAVMVIGPAKILEGIVVISAFALLFTVIGLVSRSITKGAKAVAMLGLGLIVFSMGLAALMLAVIISTPALILQGILMIAGFALIFAVIGKFDRMIATGALLLIGMSIALFLFSAGLMVFGLALKLFDYETALMGAIIIAGLGGALWLIGKLDSKGWVSRGAMALAEMGIGLAIFSVGLIVFGLALMLFDYETLILGAAVIVALALALTLVGQLAAYIMPGAIALAEMGAGLLIFSVGILAFGVAIKLLQFIFDDLMEAGKVAGGIIIGLGLAFALVGVMAGAIVPGAGAVLAMGGALITFSMGILLFGVAIRLLQLMFDDLATAGMIAGSIIIGLGLAFAIIGALSAPIILGAGAMVLMGASLVIFSVGIIVFAGVIKLLQTMFEDLAEAGKIAGAIILGMGLAFSVMGLLVIPVALGAVSMALIGTTLLIFSVGLAAFAGAVKLSMVALGADVDTLGDKMGSVITGIGWAISEVGLLVVPIALGAVSTVLMGTALLTLGMGVLAFGGTLAMLNSQGMLVEDKETGGETIKGMGVLQAVATAMAGVGWTFLTQPWTLLGIYSAIGMGVSLLTIGGGLFMAAEAMAKIPDMSKFVADLFAEGTGLIPVMADAFADIGNKYSGGVLGFLAGLVGADPVSKGMRTVSGLGEALQQIAGGIVAFSNFSAFPVLSPDPSDPSKLAWSTVDIFGQVMPGIQKNLPPLLTALADVFAEIGNKYGGTEGGWFTSGDPSPVRQGIDAVGGLGGILQEIAGSIVAFANFEAFPIKVPDPSDPSKLVYQSVNLWDVIPKMQSTLLGGGDAEGGGLIFALADVFAKIGNKYGGKEGGWFTADDPSPVRKGIDAISGLGKELEAVVGSVVKFANFENFPIQVPDPSDPSKLVYQSVNLNDVIPKIKKVLLGDASIGGGGLIMSLADVFAQIGNRYGSEEGGWFTSGSESPVRKGIDAISGLGGELESVVGAIVKFANFETFPIQVPNPADPSKLIYKSVNLFDTLPKLQAMLVGDYSLSGKLGKEGLLMSLAKIFGNIGAKYGSDGFTQANGVKEGIEAVQGVGKVLSDIAGGIIAFGEIERGIPIYDAKGKIKEYRPFDMVKIEATIKNVLTMIPKVFEGLDIEQIEKSKEIADKARPLAETIGKIAEAFQKLMKDDDGKKKSSMIGDLGPALKQFITDTQGMEIDDAKTDSLNKFATVLERLSKTGKGLGEFADSLSKTAKSFNAFTPAFEKFGGSIDKFAKFETSFSNLVKNQSQYKFDQFAKSMGTLKDNVNTFNVENLKITDSLMKSLAILSKSPDALGAQIKESIENAFDSLVEALKDMLVEMTPPPPVFMPPSTPGPSGPVVVDNKNPITKKDVKSDEDLADAFYDALKKFAGGGLRLPVNPNG